MPQWGRETAFWEEKKSICKGTEVGKHIVHLGNSPLLFAITILHRCPSLAGVRPEAVEIHRRYVMKNSYAFLWKPPEAAYTTTQGL